MRCPAVEKLKEAIGRIGAVNGDPGYAAIDQCGHCPQRCGGDNTQSALAANEQLFQVIATIVLFQRSKAFEDRAVGQDRFDASDQRPHRSMAEHLRAAGIGGNQAADRGRAFASERQRKSLSFICQGVVQILKDHTGLAQDQLVLRFYRPNPVHAAKRQENRLAAVVRSCATDHAAIAALRNDRDAIFIRDFEYLCCFLRVARRNHSCSGAGVTAAPVGEPGRHIVCSAGKALGAHNRLHLFLPIYRFRHAVAPRVSGPISSRPASDTDFTGKPGRSGCRRKRMIGNLSVHAIFNRHWYSKANG